ncbi:AAA family ATPase [Pseudomonas veronii]|uniref:AAA family ATPase n=1 Tax=Pseudomonas veronii TaxID=76761 RepID=A0A7Y1FCD9_PSEVE|nr:MULTISPECIES: AAA family ATPase [Pseudomonas]MDY7550649.1 AAA family ATPase [Pseudomonas sp. FG1]MEB0050034.1 AAA family ATPase [Pseudomonas sp. FG1]NMY13148.1 AAA family ATPase [Pseudomonas veronii]RTY59454.1 AAA family ATPase [Pseudomonas veronii]
MDFLSSQVSDKVYLKGICFEGVHNRYRLNVDFNESLSILHGQNGTGKTTLLHAIANIANCDFLRFSFISFRFVKAFYSNGNWVSVTKQENHCLVECASGDSFTFTSEQAMEVLRRNEEDRFRREYSVEILHRQKQFVESNELHLIKTSYFPAFRTILEAWSAQMEDDRPPQLKGRSVSATRKVTEFSRNLFGQFLPKINFPSPLDIENSLRNEIRDAQMKIGRYDSSVFTDSFVKVFSALLRGEQGSAQEAEEILKEISDLTSAPNNKMLLDAEGPTQDTYHQLQVLIGSGGRSEDLASSAVGALKVYRDALKDRKKFQSRIFDEVDKYFDAVNAFLDKEKKELRYEIDPNRRLPKVGLRFPDNTWSSILVMSSGERQLLTMLYAVTKMNEDALVLIDEPELSLHIDWQEELLGKMMGQLGGRQIIVCTHSPSIANDYNDYMIEISPHFDLGPLAALSSSVDDDEELI